MPARPATQDPTRRGWKWKDIYDDGSGKMTLDYNRPCGQLGPYTATKKYKGRAEKVISLACNRPYGHDGNHQWSDGYRGPRYEWDQAGRRVTHQDDPKVRS